VLFGAVAGVGLVSKRAQRRRRGDPRLPTTTPLSRIWIAPPALPLYQQAPLLPAPPIEHAQEQVIGDVERQDYLLRRVLLELLLQLAGAVER
jgi:hypothetical protein